MGLDDKYPWAIRVERFEDERWTPSRSEWDEGPWQDEPDLVEWRVDTAPGYPLLIVRAYMGALCGYVGVPLGHPFHGRSYVQGTNWSGPCDPPRVPSGMPPTCWWFGFDCAHVHHQYVPGMTAYFQCITELARQVDPTFPAPPIERTDASAYVTLEECRQRVEELAAYLADKAHVNES